MPCHVTVEKSRCPIYTYPRVWDIEHVDRSQQVRCFLNIFGCMEHYE